MATSASMEQWRDNAWDEWDGGPDPTRLDGDVETLKNRFKDRDFSLTTVDEKIVDSIPTWCTGTVAGRIFYFRFRHNEATLRVGHFDDKLAESNRQEDISSIQRRIEQNTENLQRAPECSSGAGLEFETNMLQSTLDRLMNQTAFENSAYPNVTEYTVQRFDVTNEPLSSFLAAGSAATLIGDMLDEALAELRL